jgi:glycerol-3-phosphate dehydrogenase
MQTYGNRAERVAKLTQEQPHFAYKLTDSLPFLNAEVVYQVRQEMAVRPRDVLARRWRVELSDWQLSARLTPQVVELMAAELGWTDTTSAEQIAFYQALLASFATQAGLSNRQQELARA